MGNLPMPSQPLLGGGYCLAVPEDWAMQRGRKNCQGQRTRLASRTLHNIVMRTVQGHREPDHKPCSSLTGTAHPCRPAAVRSRLSHNRVRREGTCRLIRKCRPQALPGVTSSSPREKLCPRSVPGWFKGTFENKLRAFIACGASSLFRAYCVS